MTKTIYIIFCLMLGLFFIYQHMVSTEFWIKYIYLVLGIFEISMILTRVGLYNYRKGYYRWLDD